MIDLSKPYNLIQGKCVEIMQSLSNGCVDFILTDPPYLYLKHKLDVPFDEELFFSTCYEKLKPNGYLAFFGRGIALARWMLICDRLGFEFKEEIVWDKQHNSSPVLPLPRQHEMCMVFAKGNPKFNKVFVDKIRYDLDSDNVQFLINDLKRITTAFYGIETIEELQQLRSGDIKTKNKTKHAITFGDINGSSDRAFVTFKALKEGRQLTDVIRVYREHYDYIHPTQKPIALLELLLKLMSNENALVLDPFAGSFSTGKACKNLNRRFIGIEKDGDYFKMGSESFNQHTPTMELFNESNEP